MLEGKNRSIHRPRSKKKTREGRYKRYVYVRFDVFLNEYWRAHVYKSYVLYSEPNATTAITAAAATTTKLPR